MTFYMLGREMTTSELIKCDGGKVSTMISDPNQPEPVKQTTKATWKKDKIKVKQTTHYPQFKVNFEREMKILKDGKTLKVVTINANPNMKYIQEQYFDRK